jgi:hypothetical protein
MSETKKPQGRPRLTDKVGIRTLHRRELWRKASDKFYKKKTGGIPNGTNQEL